MHTYKKRTKKDLLLDPLAVKFRSCNDSDNAFSVLQGQPQVRPWRDNDELMASLRLTIHRLYAISSGIEPGVLSPEKVIMVAIGALFSVRVFFPFRAPYHAKSTGATKASRVGQDGPNIFTRMKQFFEQLPTDTPVCTNEAIMLEVFSILTIATAEIKQILPSE